MSERLIARIVIWLSLMLVLAEAALFVFNGLRMEFVLLPLVVFLAALGVLFGVTSLKGSRPEIESVSMRRARAMKDDLVRKQLEGYEVDDEFLPRGTRKKKTRRAEPPAAKSAGAQAVPPVLPREAVDPFAGLDPVLLELAEGFGGPARMVRKIEAMDEVSYKRLQYALDLRGVDKSEFLRPVREALAKAASGPSGLRTSLDEEGMNDYIEKTLAGKKGGGDYSLDINADTLRQEFRQSPGELSHDPRSVIDHFKRALKK
ncbi:hypothetical protein [Prosthecochloris sp. GSB1]|uniref:hypothetical protein n=1 Tax=Prosthecochloris sp. GSB1 TaxID=281093 RepID=UPI0012372EC0|nr:hypothetical protein [Prosthecochloris sp. GSB1]